VRILRGWGWWLRREAFQCCVRLRGARAIDEEVAGGSECIREDCSPPRIDPRKSGDQLQEDLCNDILGIRLRRDTTPYEPRDRTVERAVERLKSSAVASLASAKEESQPYVTQGAQWISHVHDLDDG
jgi:hypothetical protein